MDSKSIYIGLVVFFIFIITLKLLKSILRASVVTLIAIILFRIGWVYSADELFSKFKLNSILKEEHQSKIYETYDEYSNRRDQGIIDTKNINDFIKEQEDEIYNKLESKIEKERINNKK